MLCAGSAPYGTRRSRAYSLLDLGAVGTLHVISTVALSLPEDRLDYSSLYQRFVWET